MTIWTFGQLKEPSPLEAPDNEPVKIIALGDLTGSSSLNGAIMLYVVEADRSMAEIVAALAGQPVEIKVSANAYPGRIYGFNERKAFRPCLRIDI